MCEVAVSTVSGSARTGIRVTVNDVEMTATTTYLDGETTVPVPVGSVRPTPTNWSSSSKSSSPISR